MSNLKITGYGDDLTIDNIRLGDLSPAEHESIEKEKGGQNYKPLENVVVSHVKDSSTLICRKPSDNDVEAYVEEELIDEGLRDYLKSVGFTGIMAGIAASILIPLKTIVDKEEKQRHEK